MRFSLIVAITALAALAMVGAAPPPANNSERTVTVKPVKASKPISTVSGSIKAAKSLERSVLTKPMQYTKSVNPKINPKQRAAKPASKTLLSSGVKGTLKPSAIKDDTKNTSSTMPTDKCSKKDPVSMNWKLRVVALRTHWLISCLQNCKAALKGAQRNGIIKNPAAYCYCPAREKDCRCPAVPRASDQIVPVVLSS